MIKIERFLLWLLIVVVIYQWYTIKEVNLRISKIESFKYDFDRIGNNLHFGEHNGIMTIEDNIESTRIMRDDVFENEYRIIQIEEKLGI